MAAAARRLPAHVRKLGDTRPGRAGERAWRWASATLVGRGTRHFIAAQGQRNAGQLAFFVLMSLAPAVLLVVAVFGVVLEDSDVQQDVIDLVLDNVPLDAETGRDQLQTALEQITRGAGQVTVVGSLLLVWSASGVMASLRYAINEAWCSPVRRPFLVGKLIDLALVLLLGLIVVASFALTFAQQLAEQLAGSDRTIGALLSLGLTVATNVLPVVVVFLLLLGMYRWLPARENDRRRAWPGALVATALVVVLQVGLRIYFSEFARVSVYGSVGGVIALLLVVYLTAIVVVLGAHVAAVASGVTDRPEANPDVRAP